VNLRTVCIALGTSVIALCAAAPAQQRAAEELDFGGVEYERLATRAETEARMTRLLQNLPDVKWGPWYMLAPFPGSEQGMLDEVWAPEGELTKMRAGGSGPDLGAEYDGKAGMRVRWSPRGQSENQPLNLKVFDSSRYNDNVTAYLYRTIESADEAEYPVTMGSDDGLRVWLNGRVIVSADVPRGLNPEAHSLSLQLEPGVNHLLCKVTQGQGGWAYQLNTRTPLAAEYDAKLKYLLDRDFPTNEQAYYTVSTIPIPEHVVLEVGGIDVLPDGRSLVCTRRGEVWMVDTSGPGARFNPTFTLFAEGLHEPLGLEIREETEGGQTVYAAYCVQRGELTRLVDLDGDDQADLYETVSDLWGVSGNYHEFAFGPKFDSEGAAWVTLNVGFCGSLGKSVVPYRGWAVRILPDGSMDPVCDGLRSPNGLGLNASGDAFYVDNQGDYVGTCKLAHLKRDSYHGHPAGLRWREERFNETEPPRQPAAVWFPYRKMGQSTADVVLDDTGGKFGPFDGQLFCGDQWSATVMRVFLEKVDGEYQGACFPFFEGFDCGVNRVAFAPDGSMLVGETNRGWGSLGRRPYGLQKLEWSGEVPFEVHEMRITPDGFELTFTKDIDEATAGDEASYGMISYTYEYHPQYGSDEVDKAAQRVVGAQVTGPRTVRLTIDRLREGGEGYVHELTMPGVRDAEGEPLLHQVAYYTVNRLPER
jgi:glucose/arabinose dehydrogenase